MPTNGLRGCWNCFGPEAADRATDDEVVTVRPVLELITPPIAGWRAYLDHERPADTIERLWLHERAGRPLDAGACMATIEAVASGGVRRGEPGRTRGHPGSVGLLKKPPYPRASMLSYRRRRIDYECTEASYVGATGTLAG